MALSRLKNEEKKSGNATAHQQLTHLPGFIQTLFQQKQGEVTLVFMGARLIPAKTTQQIVNSAFKLIKPPLKQYKEK